jgi:hypothetical protein
MLDADGSTDPAEIPAFVGARLAGADFAKGSRFLQGGGTADMPLYRKLGNAAFVYMVRFLFGGQYSDLCYGYNAFWRSAVPLLRLDGSGFEIETMMNVRALKSGLKIVEVPSYEAPRVFGVSRLKTIPDGWRVLMTIWREVTSPRAPRARGRLARSSDGAAPRGAGSITAAKNAPDGGAGRLDGVHAPPAVNGEVDQHPFMMRVSEPATVAEADD